MNVKDTMIKKAVCDRCGHVEVSPCYIRGKHGYNAGDCGGTYIAKNMPREVISGEFTLDRTYGNIVYLKHVETGRTVNIYTVDLLKVVAARGIGTLTLTESRRGREACWKAQEVNV